MAFSFVLRNTLGIPAVILQGLAPRGTEQVALSKEQVALAAHILLVIMRGTIGPANP